MAQRAPPGIILTIFLLPSTWHQALPALVALVVLDHEGELHVVSLRSLLVVVEAAIEDREGALRRPCVCVGA